MCRFHKATGEAALRWLLKQRIAAAARLLEEAPNPSKPLLMRRGLVLRRRFGRHPIPLTFLQQHRGHL
jgi:transcriptional regulator GlxA family with amidase domain